MVCKSKKKNDVPEKTALRKEIGVLQGVSIIVGVIVGSGIFVSPIGVLKHTHSVGLSFIMWLVTGVFSIFGALVYAELGVTIPKSGGEYIYILHTFGGLMAFCCLWVTFLAIGAASCAANCYIFAEYLLRPIFISCSAPNSAMMVLGLFGFLTLIIINCYSVKYATKVAIIFTTGKIIALVMIIIIGFYYIFTGKSQSFENSFEDSNYNLGSMSLAFYHGFWAFAGWNYLNFLTEEMKNPGRNLPLAITISLMLVMFVYMLANVAYLGVLSPSEMLQIGQSSSAIAVNFAQRTMGSFSWIMSIFVAASVFGSLNGEILSMSRLAYAGSQEDHLPKIFSMIHVRRMTPIPAIVVLALLVFLLMIAFDVFYLIELAGFAFTILFAMATCSLLYIRRYEKVKNKKFQLPLVVPIAFLITDVFISALALYQQPKESLLGIALMLMGIPIYLIGLYLKMRPNSFINYRKSVNEYTQKLLMVVLADIDQKEDTVQNQEKMNDVKSCEE